MNNLTFSNLNSLGDISFIAGSSYTLKFLVVNQSGSPIDISAASCTWKLAPWGMDYAIISKTGNVVATNSFEVILSATDTLSLSGAYAHQPKITFSNNVTIVPAQGRIVCIKGIS